MSAGLARMEELAREAMHLAFNELDHGTAATRADDVHTLLLRVAAGGAIAIALQRVLVDIGRRTIQAARAEGVLSDAVLDATLEAGRRSVRCPCARCVAEKAKAAS